MYKWNAGNILNYITRNEYLDIIKYHYRGNGEHPVLQDKNVFDQFLYTNNLLKAEKIGEVVKGKLIQNNNVFNNYQKVLKEYQSNNINLFIKQVDSQGGKGVFKLDNKINVNSIQLDNTKTYIIEKEIIQHDDLNKINPYCLNTLRVITVKKDNEVSIPDCFFRMGTGKSFVDNGSSGGIFVHYDIHNNSMDKVAYKLPESGGNSYYKHPTTGVKFHQMGLPYPEEVICLVTKAAKLFTDIDLIGWDIAFTPDGPLILEANDNPHIVMMQISCKGIKSNSIYNEVFKKYIR